MSPSTTVLTTVFNGEEFLEAAVGSILSQNFGDFEFLIIDDCSSDRTPELLHVFSEQDPRIKVIRNEENVGQTASLVKGIELASGDNIARLDADDIAMPGRLETQTRYLADNPDITVVGAACELIDETGSLTGEKRPAFCEAELIARFMFYNPVIHSSVMFRKIAIQRIGGYNNEFTRAQDYDLWMRCLTSNLRITTYPEVLARQRMHSHRVTNTQTGTMEQCRKTVLRNGWTTIVGTDVPNWILEETDHLLWTATDHPLKSLKETCIELRRMRQHFNRKFRTRPRVTEAFDRIISSIVVNLCASFNVEPLLYQKYVTGLLYPEFALPFESISKGVKHSANAMQTFRKSWFYNCRPMRWLRSRRQSTQDYSGLEK